MVFTIPISVILLLLGLHIHQTFALTFSTPGTRDAASTEYTKDDVFKQAVLNVTNTYRKQHNATSLKWNDTLAGVAEKWSERCVFEHSGGPTGENLSSGYANASASIVVWGNERTIYDFKKGEFSKATGHFTQLVWKSTTSVGCGRTECNGKSGKKAPGWFVVCEYYPHGNVIGSFIQNVQTQVSEDEQPDGASDPAVPTTTSGGANPSETAKECPQGGDCSGSWRVEGGFGAVWVAVLVGWIIGI
ncbi:PR-1-like protein [Massarina eburnea CBS 473.64]|uniref:PR-1-like protein n=1 Tax=Massarina eburnea CBS 473.64 TaxID=1395130 RepID=A0A6A6SGN0_9PLEO|nr:PR-1-like protein [Massarina eburnea CBS 473.64]